MIDPSHEPRRNELSWTEAVAESSSLRLPEQSWEGAAQDTGAWDPWNVTNPSSSAHDGPRNSLREVLEEHTLPPKMFVPVFTPKPLHECLVRYRESNYEKKDKLRRCDQCNEWPKQKCVGTPVVLCQSCWKHVENTNNKLFRDLVAKNDEFEQFDHRSRHAKIWFEGRDAKKS